jgi:hypothetical protein
LTLRAPRCIREARADEVPAMFAWLARRRRDKQHRLLQQRHLRLLEEARDLQRNGDIQGFAARTAAAEVAERELADFERTMRAAAAPPAGR